VADPALAAEDTVELPVQVNGRVRFTVEVPAGASEDAVRDLVTGSKDFGRAVDGMAVQRIIVVPGRIVNVVTG
jgi:leucyl-tRNA synthetase